MASDPVPRLTPVSFLQAFVTQSVKVSGQLGCDECAGRTNHIEHMGLSVSHCLEEIARAQLDYTGRIGADEYAELIVTIKNQIGGRFSRETAEAGTVRVVNTRCPFGDRVKEAPELCRMTASVFGGIAARNFRYAKVDLRRRIAAGDEVCEVLIYLDRDAARDRSGDEYRSDGGALYSDTASAELTARIEERIRRAWCPGHARAPDNRQARPRVVAESPTMRAALEAVEVVAPTLATVLITGETGVGKEIVARAVHALSERWDRKMVTVNCGAIPESLVETALFGHERGAFTGAYDVHQGFFERAEKGTLFLDEINCLPVPAQVRLLRVLQEGEFERVGGKQILYADVRIVAASNRPLEEMVAAGEFRQDLYYRLNVVPIRIPLLRDRTEDLMPLVDHFLRRLAHRHHRPSKVLGAQALRTALAYDWPGNVRELENALERAFLFSPGPVIQSLQVGAFSPTQGAPPPPAPNRSIREIKRQAAMEVEAKLMREALVRFQGNVSHMAAYMGITPRSVHMKLKAHGLDAASFRRRP